MPLRYLQQNIRPEPKVVSPEQLQKQRTEKTHLNLLQGCLVARMFLPVHQEERLRIVFVIRNQKRFELQF